MKSNHWPILFGLMAIITFSTIFMAFEMERDYAMCRARIFKGVNLIRQAPSDVLQGGELLYNEDQIKVTYNVSYPCWSGTAESTEEYGNGSTESMIPTIAYGHQAMCLSLNSLECVKEGDIVINKDSGNTHRVVKKAEDDKGVYLLTMGDNNFDFSDKDITLRSHENLCVVFGIVY